jgi:hypothetical protein
MGTTKLECYQELLVLFWKFLEENPLFMPHILTRCNVNDVIVPICFLMYKSRRDPAQIGLVHICTFVLLKLSGERSFGVSLNKRFTKSSTDLRLRCHADLLTITLPSLLSMEPAGALLVLLTIANISHLEVRVIAAVKLVNLFDLFVPVLFGSLPRHLAFVTSKVSNIIHYHGSSHLITPLLTKDAFGQLRLDVWAKRSVTECTASTLSRRTPIHLKLRLIIPGHSQHKRDESLSSSVAGIPFQPTQEWLEELKESLPMETVTRLLQHLVPVVDDIVARKTGVVDEQEILDMLNEMTMVGLLPVPHAIVIRKYQPNQYTALWFTAFMWGVIFLRNQSLFSLMESALSCFKWRCMKMTPKSSSLEFFQGIGHGDEVED